MGGALMPALDPDTRDELHDLAVDLHAACLRIARDPISSDPEDTVVVCRLCGDVERHASGCFVETLAAWIDQLEKGETPS